jgi:hypothetical protein
MKRNHLILLSFLVVFVLWPMMDTFVLAVTSTTYPVTEPLPMVIQGFDAVALTIDLASMDVTYVSDAMLRVALFDTDWIGEGYPNEASVAINAHDWLELPNTGDRVAAVYDLAFSPTWLVTGMNTVTFRTNVPASSTDLPYFRLDAVAFLLLVEDAPVNGACPDGYERAADGTCVPVPQCPDGYMWSEEQGVCLLLTEPLPVYTALLEFYEANLLMQVGVFGGCVGAIYLMKRK